MAEWNSDPKWNELKSINDGYNFNSFLDISASDFNKLVENMQYLYLHCGEGEFNMDRIYPIGSIYMTLDKTFNPAKNFGGTWTRLTDRFLVGAGNLYKNGATGGSADAVAVSHYHSKIKAYVGDATSPVVSTSTTNIGTSTLPAINENPAVANNASGTLHTNEAGVDGTGKNMPPYLAVYMWKRTA